MEPSPKRVARMAAEAQDSEWAWKSDGPDQRELGDFSYEPKNLKVLAQVLRSTLMALGHATSAHSRLVKIKSRDVSPDGALGGKGYIQRIPDMRRQLMNCVEVLSAISDTLYDEVSAPHWDPVEDSDEVQDVLEDAEMIKDDPEGWAEEDEEDLDDVEVSEDEESDLDSPDDGLLKESSMRAAMRRVGSLLPTDGKCLLRDMTRLGSELRTINRQLRNH